jgi:hypothetical protein
VGEQLLVSQEGLLSVELVGWLVGYLNNDTVIT